jgi:hypothetical protein
MRRRAALSAGRAHISWVRSASMRTGVKEAGSVPFSVKENWDGLPRRSPRHNVSTCLVPSSMVCRLSHGHGCVSSDDATRMLPQPPFIENGTDPGGSDEH